MIRTIRSLALATALLWPATGLAESLNIDFGDAFALLQPDFGAASGQAGTWNTITDSGTTAELLGLDGLATAVDLVLAPMDMGVTGAGTNATGTLADLTGDFFFESSTEAWSVTVQGLDPGLYDVYVYAPTSPAVDTGAYSVNGVPMPNLTGDAVTGFLVDVNYALAAEVFVDDGSLVVESIETGTAFFGLSGLQLVQASVPEPRAWLLLAAGLPLLLATGVSARYSWPSGRGFPAPISSASSSSAWLRFEAWRVRRPRAAGHRSRP